VPVWAGSWSWPGAVAASPRSWLPLPYTGSRRVLASLPRVRCLNGGRLRVPALSVNLGYGAKGMPLTVARVKLTWPKIPFHGL